MADPLATLSDALSLGLGALVFDAAAFDRAGMDAQAQELAVALVFMAGISQGVGHGAVLFLNHVPPLRFVLSLVLTGSIYVAGAVVTALSTELAADAVFNQSIPFGPLFAIVAIAHAPRLLGLLTLAPYMGETFDKILDLWVFALLLFGLYHGVDAPFTVAAMAAAAGWLTVRGLSLVVGRPLTGVINGLKRRVAGRPMDLDLTELVGQLKERADGLIDGRGDDR